MIDSNPKFSVGDTVNWGGPKFTMLGVVEQRVKTLGVWLYKIKPKTGDSAWFDEWKLISAES
jgi:hypothetical protein